MEDRFDSTRVESVESGTRVYRYTEVTYAERNFPPPFPIVLRYRFSSLSTMGVHDNADSKYNVMGTSSFSKLAPKRPNTVVFGENPAKLQKHEESGSSFSNVENTEAGNASVHQQRKSLPVYRLRKR